MATTLYHATPAKNRDSIRGHGLDVRRGQRQFVNDGAPEEAEVLYPYAVYLLDSLEAAVDHGRWHFDDSDVWRVDITGLHLSLDRDIDGKPSGKTPHGGTAFFTYDVVPPERLALVRESLRGVWS